MGGPVGRAKRRVLSYHYYLSESARNDTNILSLATFLSGLLPLPSCQRRLLEDPFCDHTVFSPPKLCKRKPGTTAYYLFMGCFFILCSRAARSGSALSFATDLYYSVHSYPSCQVVKLRIYEDNRLQVPRRCTWLRMFVVYTCCFFLSSNLPRHKKIAVRECTGVKENILVGFSLFRYPADEDLR
jgi:hypothetical protein